MGDQLAIYLISGLCPLDMTFQVSIFFLLSFFHFLKVEEDVIVMVHILDPQIDCLPVQQLLALREGRRGIIEVNARKNGDIRLQTEWTILRRSCVDKFEFGTKARCLDCMDLG
jgi:hypothetical protein